MSPTVKRDISTKSSGGGHKATSELLGIARFKPHAGKVEEYKRLCAQAMEIVRTRDTGTLQYDIFTNEDESEFIVVERYRDSEAAIEHFAHINDLMAPILAMGSISGEILGEPNAEIKKNLAGSKEPRLFTPWMSM